MHAFFKSLAYLKKHLSLFIPAVMLAGFVLGNIGNISFMQHAILPLTILMIYPMMVSLNFKSIFSKCNFQIQGATGILNLIVFPLSAFVLGKIFFSDAPLLAFGLLLIGLLPTSGMTISWTGFAKGNVQIAIKMTIIGLVLGSLITPLYGSLLMGHEISIPIAKTFSQILMVIFVPMGLGIASRWTFIRKMGEQRFNKNIKPKFPLISTLAVLGMIFVAMALKAPAIAQNPFSLVTLAIPISIFYVVGFLFSTVSAKLFFKKEEAVALVYGTSMRNLSVALAIALTVFSKEEGSQIALVIAVAFIIQVQAAAAYLKLIPKIFRNKSVAKIAA